MGVAPVDAARWRGFHQHRIGHAARRAVLGAKREAVHARRVETHVAQQGDGFSAGRNLRKHVSVHQHFPSGNRPRRTVAESILGAHGHRERFSNGHHRRREAMRASHLAANHHDGLDRQAHRFVAAVEIQVQRQGHSVAGEARQEQPAPTAAGIAVGHGDGIAGAQVPRCHAEHQRVRGASEAAVHAAHRRGGLGEAHGGVGRRDGDVVVAGRVVGLVGHAGHEVPGDDESPARLDVPAAHRVGLANGDVRARLERPGVRHQRTDGVRLLVEQDHLADRRAETADAPGIERIGQNARRGLGRVHRHVAPGERIGVDPRMQRSRPLVRIRRNARRPRQVRLQRFDVGAQFRRQVIIVAGQCRPGAQPKRKPQGSAQARHAAALCSTSASKASMRASREFSVSRQKSGCAKSTSRCLVASSSVVIRPVSRSSAW